jgi:hypothetical protein
MSIFSPKDELIVVTESHLLRNKVFFKNTHMPPSKPPEQFQQATKMRSPGVKAPSPAKRGSLLKVAMK